MNNKQILDNAPDGATHYAEGMHYLAYNKSGDWMRYDPNGIGGFCWFNANDFKFSYTRSFHSLSDLRRIVELENTINARNQMINEMSHLIAKEQAENERMQTFIRQHCVKWGGVAEMQPSIDVLKRCLAKGES